MNRPSDNDGNPGGGCVLRFRGGRKLAATEAAAVAVSPIAGAEG